MRKIDYFSTEISFDKQINAKGLMQSHALNSEMLILWFWNEMKMWLDWSQWHLGKEGYLGYRLIYNIAKGILIFEIALTSLVFVLKVSRFWFSFLLIRCSKHYNSLI